MSLEGACERDDGQEEIGTGSRKRVGGMADFTVFANFRRNGGLWKEILLCEPPGQIQIDENSFLALLRCFSRLSFSLPQSHRER